MKDITYPLTIFANQNKQKGNMTLSNFFKSFSSKNKVFYNLFEQATENLVIMNQLFEKVISAKDIESRNDFIKQIKDFEHKNDEITHQTFMELGRNFITPFDREDVHALASAIDDIADFIDGSSKKIMIYKMETFGKDIFEFTRINGLAIEEVKKAVYGLRNLNNVKAIQEHCIRINRLENEADDIFESSLGALLQNEKDAATIIKMKDLLQSMEFVSDKCEDAADVITSIIVKYA
jgi:predicted phosphate transport protein (TIGR00153 family)